MKYKKTGEELKTRDYNVTYYFNLFTPSSSEWKTDTVDLSMLSGANDVLIKFSFHPSFGNSIYLDNITIKNKDIPLVVSAGESVMDFNVYPNPANNHLYLINATDYSEINIFDSMGNKVSLPESNPIDITQLPSGIYMVVAVDNNGASSIRKFIKH